MSDDVFSELGIERWPDVDAFLQDLGATQSVEAMECAVAWTCSFTQKPFSFVESVLQRETTVMLAGVFTDPVDALRYCTRFEELMNHGNGPRESRWVGQVIPIHPADEEAL